MSLSEYISSLKAYTGFKGEIVSHRTLKPIKPKFAKNLPDFVHDLTPLLEDIGIDRLFVHQKKAMDHILAGRHTIIATSTASGKTLSYNLPVIDRLLSESSSKALYLFPLKALARDQLDTIQDLLHSGREIGDPVPGVAIQRSNHHVGQELGQSLVVPPAS
ncbi:MAG: DEAD/DEAH box helicase, partial [Desulfobacteraceae bacterium]